MFSGREKRKRRKLRRKLKGARKLRKVGLEVKEARKARKTHIARS